MAMSSAPSRRGSGRGKSRRMADINITPMVDVMLVLLVIFMVTAPMMTTGIPLDLPKASNELLSGSDKALRISVDKEGVVYIGTNPVDLDTLPGRVQEMLRANPELSVVISGDTTTAYGEVMVVMGVLKDAGIEKVGLETGPGGRTKSADRRKKR